jgi:hypothetical protein
VSEAQPTGVEIRVSHAGAITPLRFQHGGDWLTVAQVGRVWTDAAGDHWRVMAGPPEGMFELVRTPAGLWQVSAGAPSLA